MKKGLFGSLIKLSNAINFGGVVLQKPHNSSKFVKAAYIYTCYNIDNEPNTPTKYGVRGIPTMLLFKDGELKSTKVGATPKSDIVAWIKENI